MSLDLNNIRILDLHIKDHWDMDKLHIISGDQLNTYFLNDSSVNVKDHNVWVWLPDSKNIKNAARVYSYLNYNTNLEHA